VVLCQSEAEAKACWLICERGLRSGFNLHPVKTRVVDASKKALTSGMDLPRREKWPAEKCAQAARETAPVTGEQRVEYGDDRGEINPTLKRLAGYFEPVRQPACEM